MRLVLKYVSRHAYRHAAWSYLAIHRSCHPHRHEYAGSLPASDRIDGDGHVQDTPFWGQNGRCGEFHSVNRDRHSDPMFHARLHCRVFQNGNKKKLRGLLPFCRMVDEGASAHLKISRHRMVLFLRSWLWRSTDAAGMATRLYLQ